MHIPAPINVVCGMKYLDFPSLNEKLIPISVYVPIKLFGFHGR